MLNEMSGYTLVTKLYSTYSVIPKDRFSLHSASLRLSTLHIVLPMPTTLGR